MGRDRAFSAIIHDGKIVMVKVEERGSTYWTLPGGGVENGESLEEAAIREAMEEVNLKIKIIRYLFQSEYSGGTQYCYLAVPADKCEISLGYDPELDSAEQVLTKAEWIDISEVRNDIQVSAVLKSLTSEELNKHKII
jgi:8-oxo-dGTP diphosphatase